MKEKEAPLKENKESTKVALTFVQPQNVEDEEWWGQPNLAKKKKKTEEIETETPQLHMGFNQFASPHVVPKTISIRPREYISKPLNQSGEELNSDLDEYL